MLMEVMEVVMVMIMLTVVPWRWCGGGRVVEVVDDMLYSNFL